MPKQYTATQSLPDFDLWEKRRQNNALFSFTLELTARCNNNCRHCYINLPENDEQAKAEELTFEEIKDIVDQAVDLGAVWCLITGGEPLLREDFEEIYLYLKRKGLLVTVFTNATVITQKHIDLFKKYPPRDLEITVYGITKQTFTAVTRKPELFEAFQNGLNLLLENDISVNLKNVTIKANLEEFQQIAEFCRKHTKAPFRFDPLIHLRFDRDEKRNEEIRRQRLSAEEIAELERSDEARYSSLKENCNYLILTGIPEIGNSTLFSCGIGKYDFVVSSDGYYCLCLSLRYSDYMYNLRKTNVKESRNNLVTLVRSIKSSEPAYIQNCSKCSIINLCMWCPAHAYLESGNITEPCQYYCEVAKKRAINLQKIELVE